MYIHVIIYGDANVDAPTLCICNAAELSFSDLVLGTFMGTLKTVFPYNNLNLYLYSGCAAFWADGDCNQ